MSISAISNEFGFAQNDSALISTEDSHHAVIKQCTCHTNGTGRFGIAATHAINTYITECKVNGFWESGIALFSSTATIEANECRGNKGFGILLKRDPQSKEIASDARIIGNHIHDNKGSGIALLASTATIKANECWLNEGFGIVLRRDPKIGDAASNAKITTNLCHGNEFEGIMIISSSASVEANECWENLLSGIAIAQDSEHEDVFCKIKIIGNRCHDNTVAGILLFSASATIESNTCWENNLSGIILERNPEFEKIASDASIRNNYCYKNNDSGIVLFSSTATIEANECWENGLNGIVLQQDPSSEEAMSEAKIKANRCHDNKEGAGLAFSSAIATIEANECWANKYDQPWINYYPDSPESIINEVSHFYECLIAHDELQSQHLEQKPNYALIRMFQESKINHAVDLADFLHIGASVSCFKRFWEKDMNA